MNKALLDKFLEKGIMVSPSVADKLTYDDYEKSISGATPTLMDEDTLQKIRGQAILTITTPNIIKSEITTKDFLEYYKNKMNALGDVIARGLVDKPVSINKMLPGRRNVILGAVRDPGENFFYLEDTTGRCKVSPADQNIKEDDVLAVAGPFSGNLLSAEEFFYPELPIKRTVTKTVSPAAFCFGASSGEHSHLTDELAKRGGDVCAFLVDTTDARKLTARFLHGGTETVRVAFGPAKITISISGTVFKLQFLPGCATGGIENAARLLSKRRYASPGAVVPVFDEDFNFIEDDTDFVFFGASGSTEFTNHKGRTFVAVSDSFVEADLSTRIIKPLVFKPGLQL